MARDSFYKDILAALEGSLDPEVFEECATDILQIEWPTLVPVPGGNDAGMDGAIGDGEGEAFPLVATTEEDVIGNLTKSLQARVARGNARRKVIFATSQRLTPARRRNLESRAAEFGFTLLQVYEQSGMASRLYRSPRWCRDLLRLTGDPPCLSVIPISERPGLDLPLIGRDADKNWLTTTAGDLVLSGEPGSGKTFLLRQLALEGKALFVVDAAAGRIASELRQVRPRRLIVDDAHANPQLLATLLHVRQSLAATFDVVAVTWPGDAPAVADTLGVATGKIRQLPLLSRSEVAEVVAAVGVGGPPELVGTIVDQAEGRPGLAATLAYLCLAGDVRAVAFGDALTTRSMSNFQRLVGDRAFQILTAFAVGGSAGLRVDAVAALLGLGRADLHAAITRLAAGGALAPASFRDSSEEAAYVVRPQALREVLIRDGFFGRTPLCPYLAFFPHVENKSAAAIALTGAVARGASVPGDLLRAIVEAAGTVDALRYYASLGPRESQHIIDKYPSIVAELAQPGLEHYPSGTIPILLEQVVSDERALNSTPEHPLRLLFDWVVGLPPGHPQCVKRRRDLVEGAEKWLVAGGDPDIALLAASYAMSPGFETHKADPIRDASIKLTWGLLSVRELLEVQSLWETVLSMVERTPPGAWLPIFDAVEAWAPLRGAHYETPSKEAINTTQPATYAVLNRLMSVAKGHPAAFRRIATMGRAIGVVMKVRRDKVFDALFPPDTRRPADPNDKALLAPARALARKWAVQVPMTVFARVAAAVRESRWLGNPSDYALRVVWYEIVQKAKCASPWIEAALTNSEVLGFPMDAFLARAARDDEKGWHDLAASALSHPDYSGFAAISLISGANATPSLLAGAITRLSSSPKLVEWAVLRGAVSVPTMHQLLTCGHSALAAKAAVAEWEADPKGSVRNGLESAWDEAVLLCDEREHYLREILVARPDLAVRWLKKFIDRDDLYFGYSFRGLGPSIVQGLSLEQRLDLLKALPEHMLTLGSLARHLIGADLEFYRRVLADAGLAHVHLCVLEGMPTEGWAQRAEVALAAGYEPGAIAASAYHGITGWSGDESAYWQQWIDAFSAVAVRAEGRAAEAARIGLEIARDRRERALVVEHDEAVYGLRRR